MSETEGMKWWSMNVWSLEITKVRHSDQGIYECQTNSEVKTSVAIKLNVMGKKFYRNSLKNISYDVKCQRTVGYPTNILITI